MSNNDQNIYKGDRAFVEERFVTRATISLTQELVRNKKVLNLGLGNSKTSVELSKYVKRMVVLENNRKFIDACTFRDPKLEIIEASFEEYITDEIFEVILANHVLEHVNDPVGLMKKRFHQWLDEKGMIHITVPNAKSLHRLIGKEMGLLASEFALNESDIQMGHQRVYDIQMLKKHIEDAGFEIIKWGGYNLKMVSLLQMKDWGQDLLDAIFRVSQKVSPEICANIWVTARKK